MARYRDTLLWTMLGIILLFWLFQVLNGYLHGEDFHPLYYGAQAILQGQSPYGEAATRELASHWDSEWAYVGNGYPLPFLLVMLPFTLFSFSVAASLWILLGSLMAYASVFISRAQSIAQQQPAWYQIVSLALPFVYWPFYQGVRLSQATLIWFGLSVLLVFAIQRRQVWIVALCVLLLGLKPQNGLIFALYGLYWLWRNHKGAMGLSIGLGLLLIATSMLVRPTWIGEWLEQLQTYQSLVASAWLLPLGLIVFYIIWRFPMPWWGQIAIMQVIMFPITGIYSLLPILLAWCAFSPPMAFMGASVSMVWVILDLPRTDSMIWIFILAPLMLAILWENRPTRRTTSHTATIPVQASITVK